eukprot:TRINITY_DN46507_c0_g1_i1.p1 TRINITY_DN46507_c0_g1~~TRINITY_DN46507_c0_g1_i1.p1  ORF type:complete len:583 (-),score=66.86 TRINITY_DN46507_c0_g1_i1:382-2130(-)
MEILDVEPVAEEDHGHSVNSLMKSGVFSSIGARRTSAWAQAKPQLPLKPDRFHVLLDALQEDVAVKVEQLRHQYDISASKYRPAENKKSTEPEDVWEKEVSACSDMTSKTPLSPTSVLTKHSGVPVSRQLKTMQCRHMSLSPPPMSLAELEGEIAKPRRNSRLRSQRDLKQSHGFETFVLSLGFEGVFASLIILNLAIIALECEYSGLQLGFDVSYPRYDESADASWPWAAAFFQVAELIVGCAFTIEVALKMCALRLRFFKTLWNLFDTVIIAFWCVSLAETIIALNPMLLRLVRIVRLLRLLRLVRTFQMFDVLRLLIGSLRSSSTVLLWSTILLILIMTVTALGLNFTLREAIITNELASHQQKVDMFRYFGSFTRSVLTMYELTFANWVPVTRALHDISEWFGPVLLCYQLVVSFAVLNVIRAIFIHETMKCASMDEDLMIMERERQIRNHSEQMKTFLREADTSGDGYLDFNEFIEIMADPRVKSWLSAMQVDVRDPAALFNLLDNWDGYSESDGRLSITELSDGVARLKGPARSMDLITMMHEQRIQADRLFIMLESFQKQLGKAELTRGNARERI